MWSFLDILLPFLPHSSAAFRNAEILVKSSRRSAEYRQSSVSPIARITLDRVSAWLRTKAASSCGELEKAGSMPALSIFWRSSRSDSTALIVAPSLSIASRGVPEGATMLCQMPSARVCYSAHRDVMLKARHANSVSF